MVGRYIVEADGQSAATATYNQVYSDRQPDCRWGAARASAVIQWRAPAGGRVSVLPGSKSVEMMMLLPLILPASRRQVIGSVRVGVCQNAARLQAVDILRFTPTILPWRCRQACVPTGAVQTGHVVRG